MAGMSDAAQQRIDHGRVAEEVSPFVIAQICGDDRGVAVVALLQGLEEDVGKRLRLLLASSSKRPRTMRALIPLRRARGGSDVG
jgi:hypothetical protein